MCLQSKAKQGYGHFSSSHSQLRRTCTIRNPRPNIYCVEHLSGSWSHASQLNVCFYGRDQYLEKLYKITSPQESLLMNLFMSKEQRQKWESQEVVLPMRRIKIEGFPVLATCYGHGHTWPPYFKKANSNISYRPLIISSRVYYMTSINTTIVWVVHDQNITAVTYVLPRHDVAPFAGNGFITSKGAKDKTFVVVSYL